MENKLPTTYSLYDSSYGSEIPVDQYYVILFDSLPSKMSGSIQYKSSINEFLIKNGLIKISEVHCSNRRFDYATQSLYLSLDKKMLVKTFGLVEKNKPNNLQLEVLYSLQLGDLNDQLNLTDLKNYEVEKKKSSISLVKSDMGHMDIEEYNFNFPNVNLTLNYGENFLKVHEVIIDRLNRPNDKGIILLHGDPGTGKTSYIRYLTSLINEKEVLFIPPSMAEMLSEPSIIPFLMEHKNSILIIEDAERVISDRDVNGSSIGVSNILNLTDGILGDCLNIQVIATFNMKREKIDKALLRKGRLIAEHKFEKLNVQETEKLLKHLNKEFIVSEPMCLADIYNIDVELYKTENKETKIGFK